MITNDTKNFQVERQRIISLGNDTPTYPLDNIDYYRDIPCNNNLLAIYWIADNFRISTNDSDLIGALILSWLKKDKVELIKRKKGLLGKEVISFKFKNNVLFDNEMEQEIYEFIKNTTNNDSLDSEEFEKWCNNNPYALKELFSKIKESIGKKFIEKNLLYIIPTNSSDYVIDDKSEKAIEEERKKIEEEMEREMKKDFQSRFPNCHKVVVKNITHIDRPKNLEILKYKCSERLNQEVKNIAGLKKFIMDFSILSQRETIEVRSWEDYLVIAKLLGVANYVSKQFNDIYPNFSFSNSYAKVVVKENISERFMENQIRDINDDIK